MEMHDSIVKIEFNLRCLNKGKPFRRKNLLTKAKLLFQPPDGLTEIIIGRLPPLDSLLRM